MRLEGKVALISGGSRGQGAAEARLFAREGAAVVIADVLEEEGKKLEAEINETGGQAPVRAAGRYVRNGLAERRQRDRGAVRQAGRADKQRGHLPPHDDRGHHVGRVGAGDVGEHYRRVPWAPSTPYPPCGTPAAAPSSTSRP